MVVNVGDTSRVDTPVATRVPPQLPEYHFIVEPIPPPPKAVRVVELPAQVGLAVALIDEGAVGTG